MGEVVQLLREPAGEEPAGPPRLAIDEAGVWPPEEVPLEAYLADPVAAGSLSASGAGLLLPPSCPQKFRWWADHPEDRAPVLHFDMGTAVHTMVTGIGPRHVACDYGSWRTNAAKEEAAAIRAAGGVPLLVEQADRVVAAVDALYDHPIAAALFDCPGIPEATVVWPDAETGAWRRCRPDRLPDPGPGQMIVPDLKTTKSSDRRSASKALTDYGYARQAATILDGLAALEISDAAAFVLVFVEVEPPYLVTVYEPDLDALDFGREQNRRALRVFADCQAAGRWPGHAGPDEVLPLSLPRWAWHQLEED